MNRQKILSIKWDKSKITAEVFYKILIAYKIKDFFLKRRISKNKILIIFFRVIVHPISKVFVITRLISAYSVVDYFEEHLLCILDCFYSVVVFFVGE